ncbi:hypothetical protein ATN83_0610 [Raoultella ornithinolytica]|nr:hypothetical protein ATN83_0610 [Raoultella ornithinolytica]
MEHQLPENAGIAIPIRPFAVLRQKKTANLPTLIPSTAENR